ncbi:MAG: lysophospholipase [Nitrospirota bacterium]|nr:lysophospholipase [Nitrospirota bacterium]
MTDRLPGTPPFTDPFTTHLTIPSGGARLHVAGGPAAVVAASASSPSPEAYSPDRPGLFLLPGYADHLGRYAETVHHLRNQGYPVWGMDPRGHGLSSGRRGYVRRFADHLDDLEAGVDAAQRASGVNDWFVLAHSTGALVVLLSLLKRPTALAALGVRGAALTSPLLGIRLKTPLWRRALGMVAGALLPRLSIQPGGKPYHNSHDPVEQQKRLTDPLVFTTVNARWYAEASRAMALVRGHAGPLPLPVGVWFAGDDQLVDPEVTQRFAGDVPGVAWTRYPGMYHEILFEVDRPRVWRDIVAWLERVGQESPAGR